MKAQEVTIEINANLKISNETVERCMRLIEIWLDDNPGKTILCNNIKGHHKLKIYSSGMNSQK